MRRGQVYGPVQSRRLGLSLGVDLLRPKTCNYDCVYCQVGRSSKLQADRAEFVATADLLAEVAEALRIGPQPEVVTLAGSGEPSLAANLAEVLRGLRSLTALPLVLITNSSLLSDPRVAEAAASADIVVPSLDAGDAATFQRINRPDPSVDFETMLHGLQSFARGYQGELRLEVMLLDGVNDSEESLQALARCVASIPCSRVEVNNPVRPPGRQAVRPVAAARLARALELFGPHAVAVGDPLRRAEESAAGDLPDERLHETLRRRPSTLAQLVETLGLPEEALRQRLARGLAAGELRTEERAGATYYLRRPREAP